MDAASASHQPKVLLVSSAGEWAGLVRLPHLFRRIGARFTLLAPANTALRRSRFIKQFHRLPDSLDALVPALKKHLAQHRYDMVILGDEPAVVTVGQYVTEHPEDAAWIDEWFPVAREMHELIFCKAAFTEACREAGVPTPHSRICRSFEDLTTAAGEVGYPLAVKTSLGFGGNGVIRVNNPRELHTAFEKLRHRSPLVAQEFVAGRIGTTQMVLDRGKVLYWMPTFVTKCCPEPYGPSCVRVFLDEADLARMKPIVENVAKMTNFRGLCGIDWIQRKDGTFAVLELNPRPTPAMELGRFAGVDCAAAVKSLLDGSTTTLAPRAVTGRRKTVYLFPQHVTRCLRYHKYRDLLYWLPFVATHDVPWCEPKVMASNIWRLVKLATRIAVRNVTPWATYERPVILPEIVEPDEAAIGV